MSLVVIYSEWFGYIGLIPQWRGGFLLAYIYNTQFIYLPRGGHWRGDSTLWLFHTALVTLIKKKRKFSSYIRKCRRDRMQSHI
jgi:hypothetical protein